MSDMLDQIMDTIRNGNERSLLITALRECCNRLDDSPKVSDRSVAVRYRLMLTKIEKP